MTVPFCLCRQVRSRMPRVYVASCRGIMDGLQRSQDFQGVGHRPFFVFRWVSQG